MICYGMAARFLTRVLQNQQMSDAYDPRTFQARTFYDATEAFADSSDTPRAYLERCLEVIAQKEPIVQAFAAFNEETARAADASGKRWKVADLISHRRNARGD